jgi:hypothetical protein
MYQWFPTFSDTWKTDEMAEGFPRNGTTTHIVWYSNYTMYMSKQFIYYIYSINLTALCDIKISDTNPLKSGNKNQKHEHKIICQFQNGCASPFF